MQHLAFSSYEKTLNSYDTKSMQQVLAQVGSLSHVYFLK